MAVCFRLDEKFLLNMEDFWNAYAYNNEMNQSEIVSLYMQCLRSQAQFNWIPLSGLEN